MENSSDHVAAVAARLPPVRYYAPYEEEEPDSPQSPSQVQVSDDYRPLVLVNSNQPLAGDWSDYEVVYHVMEEDHHDDEPTPPPPEPEPEPEPEPAARRCSREVDEELYCLVDADDPESVRRGMELQSKRYAVHALRHYNADPRNGGGAVKYELVEATASQGIVLDSGHIIGHVTFTARAATDDDLTRAHPPRRFFAEVHQPDLVPSCIISMDDDYDLCQFCGDHIKHPKVPSELQVRRPIKRRAAG